MGLQGRTFYIDEAEDSRSDCARRPDIVAQILEHLRMCYGMYGFTWKVVDGLFPGDRKPLDAGGRDTY